MLSLPAFPRHPLQLARFGLKGLQSAERLARRHFTTPKARALLAGAAAHAMVPLDWSATAAFGLVLLLSAHAHGWPLVRGGMQNLTDALASCLRALGGRIIPGSPVESIDELPPGLPILLDLTPRQFLRIAGHRLPRRYRQRLERYRYGPGAFKIDWALDGPIPWTAAECGGAGTVHLGGTFEEIADGELRVWRGEHPERPFVLLVQPTLFDPTRAPPGRHIAWAYCHVPNGSSFDMTDRIESQVERFAPGFRDRILARSVMRPRDLERHNPNLVGGDVGGGAQDLRQLFARPILALDPYATPLENVYLCSAATPPGGGVHGMCGHNAARRLLRRVGHRGP